MPKPKKPETITATHMRTHLAEVIMKAMTGQKFVVTSHGRPVLDVAPHEIRPAESRK